MKCRNNCDCEQIMKIYILINDIGRLGGGTGDGYDCQVHRDSKKFLSCKLKSYRHSYFGTKVVK